MSLNRYAKKRDAAEPEVVSTRSRFGPNNSNFRNAGHHVCARCGGNFKSYNKTRKYCSFSCYNQARQKPPVKRVSARPRAQLTPCLACGAPSPAKQKYCSPECYRSTRYPPVYFSCLNCGLSFRAHPAGERKYCSYPCFVQDGGPLRAGYAAYRTTSLPSDALPEASRKLVELGYRRPVPPEDQRTSSTLRVRSDPPQTERICNDRHRFL